MRKPLVSGKTHLWGMVTRLFTKNVGISDDLRMLRDRWEYLLDYLEPSLPNLSQTFDRLDNEAAFADHRFTRHFNLRRGKRNSIDDLKLGTLEQYRELENRVNNLSTYLGLLKLAFFQRTVSLELPQITTGYPHSPERTIGNELIYIAADNVVRAYGGCIRTSFPQRPEWDGFVTYVPPILERLRYGAFCKTTDYGFYHIYLPEASKYSIGSYLLLAHEVCHISFLKPAKGEWRERKDYEVLKNQLLTKIKPFPDRHNMLSKKCETCKINLPELLDEVFADFVALKIGGPKTLEALMNEVPLREAAHGLSPRSFSLLVRAYATSDFMLFCPNRCLKGNFLRKRLASAETQLCRFEQTKRCMKCAKTLGKLIAQWFANTERRRVSAMKKFVLPKHEFCITARKEKMITESLQAGMPCPEEDPRFILHCYFLISQTAEEERASYAATIQSLCRRHTNGKHTLPQR